MHLIIKNDNRYVWVEILGCSNKAQIEAIFISDNNEPIRFKPENGIIPYNGNGLYNFIVKCGNANSNISRYIGKTKPKVFTKKRKSLLPKDREKRLRARSNKPVHREERLNLDVLTPQQFQELERVVRNQDLSGAMKLYRSCEIGSREYCCANMEVLKNMTTNLKEYKNGKLEV